MSCSPQNSSHILFSCSFRRSLLVFFQVRSNSSPSIYWKEIYYQLYTILQYHKILLVFFKTCKFNSVFSSGINENPLVAVCIYKNIIINYIILYTQEINRKPLLKLFNFKFKIDNLLTFYRMFTENYYVQKYFCEKYLNELFIIYIC